MASPFHPIRPGPKVKGKSHPAVQRGKHKPSEPKRNQGQLQLRFPRPRQSPKSDKALTHDELTDAINGLIKQINAFKEASYVDPKTGKPGWLGVWDAHEMREWEREMPAIYARRDALIEQRKRLAIDVMKKSEERANYFLEQARILTRQAEVIRDLNESRRSLQLWKSVSPKDEIPNREKTIASLQQKIARLESELLGLNASETTKSLNRKMHAQIKIIRKQNPSADSFILRLNRGTKPVKRSLLGQAGFLQQVIAECLLHQ